MQSSSHPLVRRRHNFAATVGALIATVALLLVPASASALTNYTWTGEAAPGTPNWSSTTNWGGSAPSGAVGTLTFPALTSGACTAEPPTETCYESHNDVVGLNASGLVIDDGENYVIDGNAITLGSGGLAAAPSVSDPGFGSPSFNAPITLGASQTWSITGGSNNQQMSVAKVDGAADNLTIDFVSEPFFSIEDHAEVGTFTASSQGVVGLSSASLNGATGNAVNLSHGATLFVSGGASSSGPLSLNEDSFQVGDSRRFGAATLAVNGSVTLGSSSHASFYVNHSGTVAGTDFSQVSATGNVSLGSASLQIRGLCETGTALTPGDVDTLVTATGSLSGTFSGVPDGTTVQAQCSGGAETAPSLKINYTAHAVTATVVTGGSGGTTVPSTISLHTSSGTPAIGEVVTYTARVIPQVFAVAEPSGSVEFFDGGSPIAGCSAQPLTQSQSGPTATCMVSYPAAGTHTISATYLGDAFYASSSTTGCCTVTVHEVSTGGGGTTTTPTPVPTPTPPPSPTGSVAFSKTTLTVKPNGQVLVPLNCIGTTMCRGKVELTIPVGPVKKHARAAEKAATKVIGRHAFSIAAGRSASVAIRLNAAGKKALRTAHGKLKAHLMVSGTASGKGVNESEAVTLTTGQK